MVYNTQSIMCFPSPFLYPVPIFSPPLPTFFSKMRHFLKTFLSLPSCILRSHPSPIPCICPTPLKPLTTPNSNKIKFKRKRGTAGWGKLSSNLVMLRQFLGILAGNAFDVLWYSTTEYPDLDLTLNTKWCFLSKKNFKDRKVHLN